MDLMLSESKIVPTPISPKENSGASGGFLPNPPLLRLRHPNSKKISRVFCEILSPKNSFRKTESALVPPPAQKLLGQNTKEKCPFLLEEIGRAQIRKARNIFLWCPPRLCEAVAGLIHSSSFRSKKVRAKCMITAPEQNLTAFSKPNGGTREARPPFSPPFFQTNSDPRLRGDGGFFRQETGASQRFLWHRPFSQKGLNQKQFCPRIERLLASFGKVRANHSACVKERSFLLRATSFRITTLLFVNSSLVGQSLGQDTP